MGNLIGEDRNGEDSTMIGYLRAVFLKIGRFSIASREY
jgi:hypothetical protein